MNYTLLDQYNSFVENNFIKKDLKQIHALQEMYNAWKKNHKNIFFKKKLEVKGLYIYGSVGTGKTFLLNIFYQYSKVGKKMHFNQLMNNVHDSINNNSDESLHKLENYVKNLTKNIQILFIDELHIYNIVDALIVKKLFTLFAKYKIFVLVSSNFHPKDLYSNGLQRNDFIPFIDLIINNYKILKLDNSTDYRRITLNQSKTYFTPINNETKKEFNLLFQRFVDISLLGERKINIKSREIVLKNCSANVVLCTFDSICGLNLAHEDYEKIALKFKLFFIENIPQFKDELADKCRRFISLIDMLYEHNCSTVLLAEAPINSMCQIKNLSKEFERTASRLYEMTIIKSN